MIRWPRWLGADRSTPGAVRDELVSFIDPAPTALALAGLEVPAHMQGRVLVGAHGWAAAAVRVCRPRPDGHRGRHDALGPRRALPLHPELSPELPYAGHVVYRNQSAIMQEWFRLQAEAGADWARGAVDADQPSGRGALRHAAIRIRSPIWRGAGAPPTLVRLRRAVTA